MSVCRFCIMGGRSGLSSLGLRPLVATATSTILPSTSVVLQFPVLSTLSIIPCFSQVRGKHGIKRFSQDPPHPDLFKDVEFPEVTHGKSDALEARRLPEYPKIPTYTEWHRPGKQPKHKRDLIKIRGPELVHNKLIHQQFGVVAKQGGYLRHEHFEMMREVTNRQLDFKRVFAQYRVDPLHQSWAKRPVGQRKGGGKGSIDHYRTPVKAGRVILEVGGYCTFEEVARALNHIAHVLPFDAEAVTHEKMIANAEREVILEEANINPFTADYCLKYNMMGCWKYMNYYDFVWGLKYA